MNDIKERVKNYINFLNVYILDEIDSIIILNDKAKSRMDEIEIKRILKNRRDEKINPYIKKLHLIIQKAKITKKDVESLSSLINKIVSIIDNNESFIYNSTDDNKKISVKKLIDDVNKIKEDFIKESEYLLSILKYGKKATGLIIPKTKINEKKLKTDYKKFINKLTKLILFIEKHKEKMLNFIEKEEIKDNQNNYKKIKKTKATILKVILKYNNNFQKQILKLERNEEFNKNTIKILYKLRQLLIDYPIISFFKVITSTFDNMNKNKNKYYNKTNEDLKKKFLEVSNNLQEIKDNTEIYLLSK